MTEPSNDRRIDYIEFGVADPAAAQRFYEAVFDWKFQSWGDDYLSFADGRLAGGFFRSDEVSTGGPLVVIYARDLEATQAACVEHGATIAKEIFSFPGGRRFHFTDPCGCTLAVWSE